MINVYIQKWKKEDGSWEPILGEILKEDHGIHPCPRIVYDMEGKPYLQGNPVYFNVSHSGEYLAVAVSKSPVGVDLQKSKQIRDAMFQRVVQPQEKMLIREDAQWDFLRLWTLKESFVKAEGKGLRIPFQSYYFVEENGNYFVNYGGQRAKWMFNIEETLQEGYVVSVCGMESDVVWKSRWR